MTLNQNTPGFFENVKTLNQKFDNFLKEKHLNNNQILGIKITLSLIFLFLAVKAIKAALTILFIIAIVSFVFRKKSGPREAQDAANNQDNGVLDYIQKRIPIWI